METTEFTLFLADKADVLDYTLSGQLMERLQGVFGAVMYQYKVRLVNAICNSLGATTTQTYELLITDWIEAQRLTQYLDKKAETTFAFIHLPKQPLAHILGWNAPLQISTQFDMNEYKCLLSVEEKPIMALPQLSNGWKGQLAQPTLSSVSASGAFGQSITISGADVYHADAVFFGNEWLPIISRTATTIHVWISAGEPASHPFLIRNQAGQVFSSQPYERY